jgi:hypothetical protein
LSDKAWETRMIGNGNGNDKKGDLPRGTGIGESTSLPLKYRRR